MLEVNVGRQELFLGIRTNQGCPQRLVMFLSERVYDWYEDLFLVTVTFAGNRVTIRIAFILQVIKCLALSMSSIV